MMRFTLGLAILAFTLILGIYQYLDNEEQLRARDAGLADVQRQFEAGVSLQDRIRNIRKLSMVMGDDQKFTLERMLEIGAPGMELRFVGQPRYAAGNRALFRHTFRINGPATYEQSIKALEVMATIPGFAPYKYCYNCTNLPKGAEEGLDMIQIEGYLYVYDPNLL